MDRYKMLIDRILKASDTVPDEDLNRMRKLLEVINTTGRLSHDEMDEIEGTYETYIEPLK